MTLRWDDTIAALASASGPAARGLLRISGPQSRQLVDRLFRPQDPSGWQSARKAACHPGWFLPAKVPSSLPGAVYLWPSNRSYTGQPLAELHTVGSPPLLEALLTASYKHGARPARPGEFTLRAFLAGRIDLVQAEAVLGVIDAPDHQELQQALGQLAGGISGEIAEIRSSLLDLVADLEAGLDFVEDDIEFISRAELIGRLDQAIRLLQELLDQATARMQSTGRRRVVLAGLPNAGKSTLFNALVGEDQALVSHLQGTTRDYLGARFDWNGLALELIDTAGWESAVDEMRLQAQDRREDQLQQADLILWCTPANLEPSQWETDEALTRALSRQDRSLMVVRTKADLDPGPNRRHWPTAPVSVSASAKTGLQELLDAVSSALSDSQAGGGRLLGTTASRCRASLHGALEALQRARSGSERDAGEEVVAIDLREALDHLAAILGTVYTDDILDRVFSRFCIGK